MQHFRPFSELGLLKRAVLLALACFLTLPLADIASAAPDGAGLGRARFSWEAVTDPIVSGYKVYWGTESGVYTHTEDAGNATERIVTGFSEGGEYFAAVTAYSDSGEESDYSTEISFTYDTSSLVITLTSQPQAQVVTVGEAASFSVTATGSGTLTYQWQKDVTAIAGATSPTFSINSAVVTDAGSYSVMVANAAGTTTSDSAILSVNPATPVITEDPVAAAITYGQSLAAATLIGGSASVPGTFAFAVPSTSPNAGTTYHTVFFTPTDTDNYNTVALDVSISVNRATPIVTVVPVAATILYGQPLSAATLSGGMTSVPGTFSFASPTTIPSAGTANQTVVFTATDMTNFDTVSVQVSVSVTVNRRRTDSIGPGEAGTRTYALWIGDFGSLDGQASLTDDPDGDGIDNLLEYALAGGNPNSNDCSILPEASVVTDNNQKYLAITVQKNPSAIGIACLIEISGDLVNWNAGSGHTVVVSETADTMIVRDSMPIDASTRRYLRLRIASDQP